LADVPENLRKAMKLHFVENMDQVLQVALERAIPEPAAEIEAPLPAVGPTPEPPAARQ
jgi:ATP-dependent Lon protease